MAKAKTILALMEPDVSRGGLTKQQVKEQLLEADANYVKWGFVDDGARGDSLYAALFADEPVEWNRIGLFQDVTLRLIASRILHVEHSTVIVQGELINQTPKLLLPPVANHHVYCSGFNSGARALMLELGRLRGCDVQVEDGAESRTYECSKTVKTAVRGAISTIYVTTDVASLPQSDHMLLYLNGQTWTRGGGSDGLGEEVMKAMDLGVHILLAHEMPGAGTTGQVARNGCDFSTFFACEAGTTPPELLKRGIYSTIAVPLKGSEWRVTSLLLLYNMLATGDLESAGVKAELIPTGELLDAMQGAAVSIAAVTSKVSDEIRTLSRRPRSHNRNVPKQPDDLHDVPFVGAMQEAAAVAAEVTTKVSTAVLAPAQLSMGRSWFGSSGRLSLRHTARSAPISTSQRTDGSTWC